MQKDRFRLPLMPVVTVQAQAVEVTVNQLCHYRFYKT
jgi:hypothetical protein